MTATRITKELLANGLLVLSRRVRNDRCEMSQEEIDELFDIIQGCVNVPVSKEEACGLLGISRATFDTRVAKGELPAGRHRRGFKEKVWYKNELGL